jgi:plastocyanin
MRTWFGSLAFAITLAAGAGSAAAVTRPGMQMGTTCSPQGTSLSITAMNTKFDKDCLAVSAGQPFTIRFYNQDSIGHSVAILPSHTSTQPFFRGDIVAGPKAVTYSVPALTAPGTYHFHCDVHPNLMMGTFIVAEAAPTVGPMPAPSTPPASAMPKMAAKAPSRAPAVEPATSAEAKPQDMPAMAATPAMPSVPARQSAAASMAHTGPRGTHLLVLLAGIALAGGGLAVTGGARRAGPSS